MTYTAKADADAWLATQRAQIVAGTWLPSSARQLATEQAQRSQTLGAYANIWMPTRTNRQGEPLRPRTLDEYRRLLSGPLAPLFDTPIASITPASVREWRASDIEKGKVTQTSRAYDLLRGILNTAVDDGLIASNPCRVKGGGAASSRKKVLPPTEEELADIIDQIEPKYRALVVVAANGGLRFGEATELRRRDLRIEVLEGVGAVVRVRVERGVIHSPNKGYIVGRPKSDAGIREVAIFGLDAEIVKNHAACYTGDALDSLLFPAADGVTHLGQSTFYRHWDRARKAAGRPDMPFHALRHFAGTAYAQAGATPRETMARLGHSSLGAAMRYQHAGNRDDELAARMARR